MTTRKSTLKNIVFGCVLSSEHRIDILNVKSIGKTRLCVFIIESFIEKMVTFWDSIKKFKRSQQGCSIQKVVLKNFAIFTGKHLCWCLF